MTLIRENATYKDVNTALLSLDTQIKNNNISILKKLNDTINNLDNSSSDDSKLKDDVASNTTSINSLETDINSLKDDVASNTTSVNSLKTSINSLKSSKLTIAQTNCEALGFTPYSKISLLTFVKKLISTYGNNAFIVFDWADAKACYVTCKNTTALPNGLLLTGGYLLYRSNGALNEIWADFSAHYIASNGEIYLLSARILDSVSNYQENMFKPVFTTDTKITAPTLQASSNLVIPTAAPATLTDGSIWVEA